MNIKNSGKIPDKIKCYLTALSLLSTMIFSGCTPGTSESVIDPDSGVTTSVDVSTDSPNEESSVSSKYEQSEDSSSITSVSSPNVPNSDSSQSSEPEQSSDVESGVVSSTHESSASVAVPPESGESVVEPPPESSESTVDPPSESSSSEPPTESSSESTPDPPPVVIPDPAIPTSPGTQCAITDKGVIDYSNVSQGYVSACYTGSKSKVKLRIEKIGAKPIDHDLTPDGSVEYFPITLGDGEYNITVFEQVSGDEYSRAAEQKGITVVLDSQLAPFLYPNRYSDYDKNSECVYKAAELCAGKMGTIEKISAIFEWITENVTYDHELAATVQKGYVPDPERTYNSRTGICYDYASLMCAMLRSQSIPTRLVKGYAAPEIYHAWNEVYTEETGWITPELMFKNAGYNIADSTFYASAGDKAQIASYISDASNYQVLYYY